MAWRANRILQRQAKRSGTRAANVTVAIRKAKKGVRDADNIRSMPLPMEVLQWKEGAWSEFSAKFSKSLKLNLSRTPRVRYMFVSLLGEQSSL